jgi:hypothetical protein
MKLKNKGPSRVPRGKREHWNIKMTTLNYLVQANPRKEKEGPVI